MPRPGQPFRSTVMENPTSEPPLSEDALLAWLRELDPELEQWIGDDTALLPEKGPRIVTIDTQIEGTHYLKGLDPQTVARRLLAVNLSDLAAAGAKPAFCFLALATPPAFDHRGFFRAFLEDCHRYHVQLAGGDLAGSPQTVAALTLLGEIPEGGRWLRRTDGRAGDSLWLGGMIGASALGRFLLANAAATWRGGEIRLASHFSDDPSLRRAACRAVRCHLAPTPQLELGWWLGRQDRAATIDLSDGLGKDLSRLCKASGVGAEVDVMSLPLCPELDRLSKNLQQLTTKIALAGGEDYVLLFSLPPEAQPPTDLRCRRIGTLTEEPAITWVGIERLAAPNQPAEAPNTPESLGWDHLHGR